MLDPHYQGRRLKQSHVFRPHTTPRLVAPRVRYVQRLHLHRSNSLEREEVV